MAVTLPGDLKIVEDSKEARMAYHGSLLTYVRLFLAIARMDTHTALEDSESNKYTFSGQVASANNAPIMCKLPSQYTPRSSVLPVKRGGKQLLKLIAPASPGIEHQNIKRRASAELQADVLTNCNSLRPLP